MFWPFKRRNRSLEEMMSGQRVLDTAAGKVRAKGSYFFKNCERFATLTNYLESLGHSSYESLAKVRAAKEKLKSNYYLKRRYLNSKAKINSAVKKAYDSTIAAFDSWIAREEGRLAKQEAKEERREKRRKRYKGFIKDLATVITAGAAVIASTMLVDYFQPIEKPKLEEVKKEQKKELKAYQRFKSHKAIYLTSGRARNIDRIFEEIEGTGVNSLIITLKNYTGFVTYNTKVKLAEEIGAENAVISDLERLVKKCHDKELYTIAYFVLFKDPKLAKARPHLAVKDKRTGGLWARNNGSNKGWLDPYSSEAQDYLLALLKEAQEAGFDELNLDYVRSPAGENMRNALFAHKKDLTLSQTIGKFLERLGEQKQLSTNPNIKISLDVFGITTYEHGDRDAETLGQRLDVVVPKIDYLCPMIYTSHVSAGLLGRGKNPVDHPYETIAACLRRCKKKFAEHNLDFTKVRPWLQNFSYRIRANKINPGGFDKNYVLEQIMAVKDSGLSSYSFWNALSKHEVAFSALKELNLRRLTLAKEYAANRTSFK